MVHENHSFNKELTGGRMGAIFDARRTMTPAEIWRVALQLCNPRL